MKTWPSTRTENTGRTRRRPSSRSRAWRPWRRGTYLVGCRVRRLQGRLVSVAGIRHRSVHSCSEYHVVRAHRLHFRTCGFQQGARQDGSRGAGPAARWKAAVTRVVRRRSYCADHTTAIRGRRCRVPAHRHGAKAVILGSSLPRLGAGRRRTRRTPRNPLVGRWCCPWACSDSGANRVQEALASRIPPSPVGGRPLQEACTLVRGGGRTGKHLQPPVMNAFRTASWWTRKRWAGDFLTRKACR